MTRISDAARWSRCRVAAALFTVAALSAPALAADSAGNDINDFTLSNGMEVVVIPDHRAPIVTHMVWYKIGGADDPPANQASPTFSST